MRNEQCPHVDIKRIEKAVQEILAAVGEDGQREGLKETPQRVADVCRAAGGASRSKEHLTSIFNEKYDEIVLLRDIPFQHLRASLMPLSARRVAYLPAGKVLGISKLRGWWIRRPAASASGTLTDQIADFLMQQLARRGQRGAGGVA